MKVKNCIMQVRKCPLTNTSCLILTKGLQTRTHYEFWSVNCHLSKYGYSYANEPKLRVTNCNNFKKNRTNGSVFNLKYMNSYISIYEEGPKYILSNRHNIYKKTNKYTIWSSSVKHVFFRLEKKSRTQCCTDHIEK